MLLRAVVIDRIENPFNIPPPASAKKRRTQTLGAQNRSPKSAFESLHASVLSTFCRFPREKELRPDEVPSLKLPSLPTRVVVAPPRRPLFRYDRKRIIHHVTESEAEQTHGDVAVNMH